MIEIRRAVGTIIARYPDGTSYQWPNGHKPVGEIVFWHSDDDGKTWREFGRGQFVTTLERQFVTRFVPA